MAFFNAFHPKNHVCLFTFQLKINYTKKVMTKVHARSTRKGTCFMKDQVNVFTSTVMEGTLLS